MGNRLFVGNLSWNVDDNGLRDAFEKHGDVTDCRIITDRETGRSKGFGFVTFADEADAETALGEMNGADLDGRPLRVDSAHEKGRGGGGGRRDGGGGGGGYNRQDDRGNRW